MRERISIPTFSRRRRSAARGSKACMRRSTGPSPSSFSTPNRRRTQRRLIEVGLVETDVEQNITGGLHFRCNPHRRSQARARRVHGIQDCELEHCPEFAARADELLEAVRGKTVVIHDRTMDLLWLNRELQATRPGAPRFEDCCTVIDSFVLARAVPSERRRNGLDALLEWYGLGARGGHHDAYGDASPPLPRLLRTVVGPRRMALRRMRTGRNSRRKKEGPAFSSADERAGPFLSWATFAAGMTDVMPAASVGHQKAWRTPMVARQSSSTSAPDVRSRSAQT